MQSELWNIPHPHQNLENHIVLFSESKDRVLSLVLFYLNLLLNHHFCIIVILLKMRALNENIMVIGKLNT